jgi:hypothetical protein
VHSAVGVAHGMHERTRAGSPRNGHTASGGDGIVTSSLSEIIAQG